ncbi:hypothetical protein [Agrobacterium sp. NPDC089420]|uniref:hypothetical protein n=1 Tax=Agrobacterium sp. NPDC089420 TaxID=3363918 RepID=UPI00384FC7AB
MKIGKGNSLSYENRYAHQDVERALRPIKFQISTGGMQLGHNFVSFRSHFGNIRQIGDDALRPPGLPQSPRTNEKTDRIPCESFFPLPF